MKGFSKIVALGAVLAASSSLAFATPISGTVGFSGAGTFTGGPTGTFTPGTTVPTTVLMPGTGTFSPFTYLTPATFYSFTLGSPSMTGETLFSSTAGAETLTFLFQSTDTSSLDTTGNGVTLTGLLSETGYTSTPGTLDISANGGSAIFTAGVNAVSATPEPSSLVLLGTGLLGAASAAFRKRGLSS